jgi:hypothetical protein
MHVEDLEVFNLYGFVIHEGNQTRKGHYSCVVKGIDDQWYICNDSVITKLNRPITKEDTDNAYMLFYQKHIQAPPKDVTHSSFVKEEVKLPAVTKSTTISSGTLNIMTSAPIILSVPPVTSDEDDDDFLPDFALIESLQRYPSAYPSKDRITNKLTEIAGHHPK